MFKLLAILKKLCDKRTVEIVGQTMECWGCTFCQDIAKEIMDLTSTSVDKNAKLSYNRSIGAYAVSSSYPDLALQIEFSHSDYIKYYQLDCLLKLVELNFKQFAVILSGKRSTILNDKVGGSSNSAHLSRGLKCAVDFFLPNIDMQDVYDFITTHMVFGECIYYKKNNFIHLTLPFPDNYMEYFVR